MKTAVKSSKTAKISRRPAPKSLKDSRRSSAPVRAVPAAARKAVDQFVPQVQKRDGSMTDFDIAKITTAAYKAMLASGEGSQKEAELIATKVYAELVRISKRFPNFVPHVEGINDAVEKELILSDYVKTAKSFILYRNERNKLRAEGVSVPEHVRKLASDSKNYFRNPLAEFVYYRTYSRWIEAESRRETWIETVDRFMSFMREGIGSKLKESEYKEVRESILKQEALPSMRLLQFAGEAARKNNICAYNCSYAAPSKLEDFAEIMIISMCGTGVGFSVESQNIEQLPQIAMQTGQKAESYIVDDSKYGWGEALTAGLRAWFGGKDIEFDYSMIRPSGARLKTMGGKASGPEPLRALLAFAREKILKKQGRRLSNLDVHDIICKIGDCVVAGGVRRSAMISLSDLDNEPMRDAKKGAFYYAEPQRSIANNSAVYTYKPSNTEFMDEWMALMKSGAGERGIFNRGSLMKTLPERRLQNWAEDGYIVAGNIVKPVGTNPCGEIVLRPKQFCNLSEIVCRHEDTEESLLRKARVAALLGTYQSTLTNFVGISKEWQENCERERLLGVSLTGQWDCPLVRQPEVLNKLREEAVRANAEYAKRFGINASTCVTCVKPSGTASQVVDASSGMHPRHAPYYIRRVRISATDSLFKMLRDQGVPFHPEVGQSMEDATTFVLEFPVKAPEGSVHRDDISALEQLEHWKMVKTSYTEHNPSTTISVGENEWIAVQNWVYENWDIVGGLSFLPRENHVYQLAPYEECTEAQYQELKDRLAHIDYSKIITYEKTDELDVKKELACMAGACEII